MHNHTTAHDILADLHAKLGKSKRTGDKLTARCPAHDDKTPSLSVKIGDNDCVILKCFAGCPTDAVLDALGWTMRDLFATDDAWRSHEARDIGDEKDAAKREASPLPRDTPGKVRLWIEALTDADLDAQLRILHLIAEAPEWASLVLALRIAVVGAIKGRTEASMATAILGRFDDRKMAWREPPTEAVDTSEPDVVSLATLLADPPDPSATVARGLAFGGTMGFIHGPKASGKTTILAAAAARVSRGQPWAGQDTEAGTVLVVCNDDPRSWTLALRDFRADPERILMARARVVSRPGRLAALLAKHTPAWVIIDNMRTWCQSMNLDVDSSSSAADAIDPIAEAIRECGCACTIVHNEARSKGEGTVVKGVTGNAYVNRLRNSTVFEDAADWIVGCAHADGSTKTMIMAGEKTRREIPTETLIIDLDTAGHGTPSTGGGDDPFTAGAPVNLLDATIDGYLMANPQGVSLRAIRQAVKGRASQVDARLKLVGECGPDKLWRSNRGACPVAETEGGGDTGHTVSQERVPPLVPLAGHAGTHCVPPIGDTGSGHGVRDTVSGHGLGERPTENLRLADSENTPPPLPTGGAGEPAKDHEAMAKHVGCLRCGGTGLDGQGKPCGQDWYMDPHGERQKRGVPPVTHTSGIKKWDNATSTWVDTVPDDDCFTVGGGVHLSDRTTVTDGDPSIHWDESWNDIELENEGTVH